MATLITLSAVVAGHVGAQGVQRRTVFAGVLDAQGHPVSGLTGRNFTAEFRGQPVAILSATEDTTPRRVAIVIDVSGSQTESIRLEWAQAIQLIDRLLPRAAVALFTVGDSVKTYSDFTMDRGTLENAILRASRLELEDSSSLYDGIVDVAGALPDSGTGDAICLFSDGDDTSSRRSPTQAARDAASKNIRVFVMGDIHHAPFRLLAAKAAWKTITDITGGGMVWFDPATQSPAAIPHWIAEVVTGITSTYRITLGLTQPVDKPGNWSLRVIDSSGHARRDVRLSYPQVLVPLGD